MKKIVKDLASDFKRWGLRATRRVQKGTEKWGVVFGDWYTDWAG